MFEDSCEKIRGCSAPLHEGVDKTLSTVGIASYQGEISLLPMPTLQETGEGKKSRSPGEALLCTI
jgi:hypothetical protein